MLTSSHEDWRAVVGYAGSYEVSSLGRVRGVTRTVHYVRATGEHYRIVPELILAQTPDRSKHSYGRLTVKLSVDGKAVTRLVHQLVAEAFIGQRPEGMQVAHSDGNPANNRLDNLRYATARENTHDKFRHGTMLRGEAVGGAKLTADAVRAIRTCGLSVTAAAREFGISIGQVSRIRSGSRWGHVV